MMNRLTIQYFAAYREATGQGSEDLESAAATAGELFEELQARHPELTRFPAMRVAINDRMAEWSDPLADGDTVLLFPPVAGG